jgi:hypothetical protein
MAAKPFSTTRRALLGAAATLPLAALSPEARTRPPTPFVPSEAEGRTRWNIRLTRYQRLAASAKAAAETGWFRAANDRYNRETIEFEKRALPSAHPEEGLSLSKARLEGRTAAFTRVTRAENLYFDRHTAPLMRAATLLGETPVPGLPALLAKIRVMQAHELQEEGALPRPALQLLAEDVKGLLLQTQGPRTQPL